MDDAGATEVGHCIGGDAPEPELRGDLGPTGLTRELDPAREVCPVELYEVGARGAGYEEKCDDNEEKDPGRHLNGEYSALLGSGNDARICRPGLEPRRA